MHSNLLGFCKKNLKKKLSNFTQIEYYFYPTEIWEFQKNINKRNAVIRYALKIPFTKTKQRQKCKRNFFKWRTGKVLMS